MKVFLATPLPKVTLAPYRYEPDIFVTFSSSAGLSPSFSRSDFLAFSLLKNTFVPTCSLFVPLIHGSKNVNPKS